MVCGHGTTNDGFGLVAATPASVDVPTGAGGTAPQATYDVTLAPGSFLLGGQRHVWPQRDGESFLAQSDWLQLTGIDAAALPVPPAADRTDLVYLTAFEHPVRAVEDRELRERALGGPDTSTRLKALRRIAVLTDVAKDCGAATAQLQAAVTAPAPGDTSGAAHGFDAEMCEVLSKVRLTVEFTGRRSHRRPLPAARPRRLSRRREPGDPDPASRPPTVSFGRMTTASRCTGCRSRTRRPRRTARSRSSS